MKNFLIAFSVFIIWSVFGLWLYSVISEKDHNNLGKADSTVRTSKSSTAATPATNNQETDTTIATSEFTNDSELSGLKAINSEGDIVFYFSEGMKINKNNPNVIIPASLQDYKYKVNTYMLQNPESEVHIASVYSASERLQSPNLGIQRGNFIKEQLIGTGVPANKIVIKPIIKDISFEDDSTFTKAISLSFKPLDVERIESLKSKIPETKTFYPKFSIDGIMANDNLRNLMEEIKTVTTNNPDIQVEIIGHTDNIGNSIDNYRTGLDFARQVRWYVIRKGNIDSGRIKATSRGEEDPIDTNNTQRGRMANQRIEVVFYLN